MASFPLPAVCRRRALELDGSFVMIGWRTKQALEQGIASHTALAAARHRAAHQLLGRPLLFVDPLALRIVGEDRETILTEASTEPKRRMRAFIAMRTRFAEDALAAAVSDGVEQLVVLGAGLDTFAYRNPHGFALKVFEVDHPATQTWKRERLAAAEIAEPPWLRFVPVDFERDLWLDALKKARFDEHSPAFFTWMGVVPYLTEDAIFATLREIAGLGGSGGRATVVFDYSDPPETLDEESRVAHAIRAQRVAALGEPWLSYFEPAPLRVRLLALGFSEVEDLDPAQMMERYYPGHVAGRGDTLPRRGGHVLRARTG